MDKDTFMHYCYILYSLKTEIFYIDTASDLERAVSMHNNARITSTKPHLPWELVWQEEFATEVEAAGCARYLRSIRGTEFNYKKLLELAFGASRRHLGRIGES